MGILMWMFLLFLVFVAVMYMSPKWRKAAFIWSTYITLTGWYYFRLLEKKRAMSPAAKKQVKQPKHPLSTTSSSSSQQDPDVVFFESPETLRQRQLQLQQEQKQVDDMPQRAGRSISEHSSRLSDSGSSDHSFMSEDSVGRLQSYGQPKTHIGVFRKLGKTYREEKRRASEANVADARPPTTRRTYKGMKKPISWAD